MFGRSWVQFISETPIFSLSHARVMLINHLSHFITELKIHHLYSLIKIMILTTLDPASGNEVFSTLA